MAISTTRIHIFNLAVKVLPPSRCNKIKVALLRWAGVKVGNNVSIFNPTILGPMEFIIGDNCWIGHESFIFGCAGSKIEMKEHSKIASKAILVTGYHEYGLQYDNIAGPGKFGNIRIEKGATIGTHAMVYPNVTVGEKSHVAAFAVATKDVPPHVRVGGIPAKVIKNFDE